MKFIPIGFFFLFASAAQSSSECSNLFPDSIQFYNSNAQEYAGTRAHVSPGFAMQRERFISLLPEHAHILEIGAGHGRDARYFLDHGLRMTITEPSFGLAQIAAKTTGAPIFMLPAQNIGFQKQFDGVWASASLIHVPAEELRSTFLAIKRAMKVGGIFHASFLRGVGTDDVPERIADGRYFNRASEAMLRRIVSSIDGLQVMEEFTGTQVNDYFGKLAPSKEFGFFNLYVIRRR